MCANCVRHESPKPVGTFSLAVNERWKAAEGALRQCVEWFQIARFGRLAEVYGECLKCRHVYLEGRLQTRNWEGPDGQKRTTIKVVANHMQILDRLRQNGNCVKAHEPSKAAAPVEKGDNPLQRVGKRDDETSNPVLAPSGMESFGTAGVMPRLSVITF